MSYAGKVRINNVDSPIASALYGVCTTPGSTAAKIVSLSAFDALMEGVSIAVKFSQANTVANPTLNVNGTGDIPIYVYGSTKPGTTAATSWASNSIVTFTYDGTNWCMNDVSSNNSIISMLESEVTTEATARATAITQVYSRIAANYDSSATYRKNQLVIYNQNLYRCNNDITVAEAWTAAHWTATTVAAEREYKLVFDSGDIGQIGVPSSATIAAGGGNTGVLNPELNLTTYEAVTQTSESFTFNGTKWIRTSTSALLDDLSQFGISWPEEETPAEGDTISVTYVAGTRPFLLVGTYNEYPYRAAIDLPNVKSTMVPEVVFGLSDAISGLYAPIAEAYDGGIYIYATNVPPAAITIPTIICWG